ncbi:permease of phosphate ABC transporter [Clostridium sp. MCC353]|uniref:permease of phosphate ABC transporter n=1 Tax=Clostridium sp. MCC353 TaxID=2592646 RepID=UPI001C0174D8|nr:permease of phosphate ABC transporter [Clostridium sp. MCC353]MBT9775161.1 permease of phosphate ABC transporter [Clostridium sp. MCC353]
MKTLTSSANEFIKQCQWTDLALLKFCLCAMGVLIGLGVSKKKKKPVFIAALVIFLITYIPVMAKYLLVLRRHVTDCVEDTL